MKKLFFTIVLLASMLTYGQSSVGLKMGSATLVEDFDDRVTPKSGISFEINFEHNFNEYIGAIILYRRQINKVDVSSLEDLARKNYHKLGYISKIESEPWIISRVFIGLVANVPVREGDKFFVTARFAGGLIGVISPEMTIKLHSSSSKSDTKVDEKTANGFGYLLGTGFKFKASKNINLNFNLDYSGGSVEFKNVRTTTANDGSTEVSYEDIEQPFSSILLSLGLDYKF